MVTYRLQLQLVDQMRREMIGIALRNATLEPPRQTRRGCRGGRFGKDGQIEIGRPCCHAKYLTWMIAG
jgi:hypothetical protein